MIFDLNQNNDSIKLEQELNDPNKLLACYVIDEVSRMSDEERAAFLESEQCEMLVTEGIIGKKTIIKLSKEDELFRRKKVAALQIAKDKNDKLYDLVLKYRSKEKEAFAMIMKKYGMTAERVAKQSQKEYLKKIPIGSKMTLSQNKNKLFGDVDRSTTKKISTINS